MTTIVRRLAVDQGAKDTRDVVLIVEDEPIVRMSISDALLQAGFEVPSRMRNGSTSFPVAIAFDEVAEAIMNRRRGYCFEWDRLAQRTPADWDRWLSGGLRRLRW